MEASMPIRCSRYQRVRSGARRTKEGQALVEFCFVFLPFLVVFFGIVEISLIFNAVVTLDAIALEAARKGALDDPFLSVDNAEVASYVQTEMNRYGYLDSSRATVTTTVNYVLQGPSGSSSSIFLTRVIIQYDYVPLLLGPMINPPPRLTVSAVKLNELQFERSP